MKNIENNQLNRDELQLVADVVTEMTNSQIATKTRHQITEQAARVWVAYYADEAAAADPRIVAAVLVGYNNRNNN